MLIFFSCKNEKKINTTDETYKNRNNKEQPISEAQVPIISRWTKNNISIVEGSSINNSETVVLTRTDAAKPSFASFENIQIYNGSTYKISFKVKSTEELTAFGLRIQKNYQNRVDALFGLDQEKIIATNITGKDFAENVTTEIIFLEDGWYQCIIYADLYTENVRVVFGPSKRTIEPEKWEAKTNENNSIILVPTAIKIQEF